MGVNVAIKINTREPYVMVEFYILVVIGSYRKIYHKIVEIYTYTQMSTCIADEI